MKKWTPSGPSSDLIERWTEQEIERVFQLLDLETPEKRRKARNTYAPLQHAPRVSFRFGLSDHTQSIDPVSHDQFKAAGTSLEVGG